MGIGFGPRFAPKEHHVKQGFDWVFTNIRVSDAIKADLLVRYQEIHPQGSPRDEEKLLAAALPATWEWPWFDEWRERFVSLDHWPFMWERNGGDARVKTRILAHTLAHRIYEVRRVESMLEKNRQYDLGLSLKLDYAEGDVIRPFVADQIARLEAGDLTAIPPYFPGDRSMTIIQTRGGYG